MVNRDYPPRFFYFDLGNVLLDFDHAIACRNIAALTGLTPQRVREIVFDSGLELCYERGDLTCREFWLAFCESSATEPDFDSLLAAAGRIFWPTRGTLDLVRQLKQAGHRLGILSNTCAAHWQRGAAELLAADRAAFEATALSFELRRLKPEPEIYWMAAELVNVAAAEIFFVDDREENVAAARQAGFDAVQFTSAESLANALNQRGVRCATQVRHLSPSS